MTATRCGREHHPLSPRPEPAQRLVDRMVIDAEVLRDRADANAAVTHRRDPRRDRPVERRLDRLGELSLNENQGNGAKPLRTLPPLLVGLGESQNTHRKNSESG